MSDPSEKPWSDSPNAPQIPPSTYLAEKEFFAGQLIGAISYGTLIYAGAYLCLPCPFDPYF